jgi:hypothetical protein
MLFKILVAISNRNWTHLKPICNWKNNIVRILEWLYAGFGLVIGFIEHLQNVTTNNYDSLTELHTPKITINPEHIKSFQFAMSSPVVAWWRISTMSSAFVLTSLPAGDCLTTNSKPESKLLYDWLFTASQFVLAPSPPCGHSRFVTASLTRG